jgi:hypothetical protein
MSLGKKTASREIVRDAEGAVTDLFDSVAVQWFESQGLRPTLLSV